MICQIYFGWFFPMFRFIRCTASASPVPPILQLLLLTRGSIAPLKMSNKYCSVVISLSMISILYFPSLIISVVLESSNELEKLSLSWFWLIKLKISHTLCSSSFQKEINAEINLHPSCICTPQLAKRIS